MANPIRNKLTKAFFMHLPEGVYLCSGCHDQNHLPVFAEFVVESGEARKIQWELIKTSQADQRNCYAFQSREEYIEFVKNVQGFPCPPNTDTEGIEII